MRPQLSYSRWPKLGHQGRSCQHVTTRRNNLVIYSPTALVTQFAEIERHKGWMITTLSGPVVDGLRRSFHHAVQSDVGAEWSAYQLIVNLNDRVDCIERPSVRSESTKVEMSFKNLVLFFLLFIFFSAGNKWNKTHSER